jgi:hypothetical protein
MREHPVNESKKNNHIQDVSVSSKSMSYHHLAPYSHSHIMQLQKTIGNQGVMKLLQSQAQTIQRVPTEDYSNEEDGTYWENDATVVHNGETVPSNALAVMRNPGDGGTPSVDPPGWDWLKTKFGRLKGHWVRFHIINAQLGGPGGDTTNLVPTLSTLNQNANWRQLEEGAKSSASTDQDWTYVEVDLNYDNEFPAGIPENITAEWGYLDGDDNWQTAGYANLNQLNPDDDDNNNYLQASQVTNGMLRGYGLTNQQAQAMRNLIDDTYEDQNDFEIELAGNGNHLVDDNLIVGNWYDVAGRFYVDEDDDIAGPYPVVVRNT